VGVIQASKGLMGVIEYILETEYKNFLEEYDDDEGTLEAAIADYDVTTGPFQFPKESEEHIYVKAWQAFDYVKSVMAPEEDVKAGDKYLVSLVSMITYEAVVVAYSPTEAEETALADSDRWSEVDSDTQVVTTIKI